MPIITPDQLPPECEALVNERVPIMRSADAKAQSIRPLNIGLLNIMPEAVRERTEAEWLRIIGQSPLQVHPHFVWFDQFNRSQGSEHRSQFYHSFSEIQQTGLDGLIITGDNQENRSFEEVAYKQELEALIFWAERNVASILCSCWAAHYVAETRFGIARQMKEEKIFGVFSHQRSSLDHPLAPGLDDRFLMPHSRFGDIPLDKVQAHPDLAVLASSSECGLGIASSKDGQYVLVQGHPEYSLENLDEEYQRDKELGLGTKKPQNYYNYQGIPESQWRANASVFGRNWLDMVYRRTHKDPLKHFME